MTTLILMEAPLRREIIQATMMHVYSDIRFLRDHSDTVT
jgi:hypothetical protein